jgi:hypothetical protein
MKVSAWKGEVLGVRVGKLNREKHFSRDWTDIQIELDGKVGSVTLSSGFWRECPEVRSKAIEEWLFKHGLAPWPKGKPPELELTPLGGPLFRLTIHG